MIQTNISENIKDIKNTNINIKQIKNKDTVLWPSFDDVIGAPGNRKLLAGNMQAGWFGEVPASDFITGDALAKLVGITEGVSQYSNEPWLKFAYKDSVLLVSKKNIRYNLNWGSIEYANCVYGDRIIEIKNKKYKIMLMRGTGEDVQPDPKVSIEQYDGKSCYNSMWNTLMMPIHQKAPNKWLKPENVNSPTENWGVGYTNNDLNVTEGYYGNSWCQETCKQWRVVRGGYGVSRAGVYIPEDSQYGCWRPCLQLIG